MKQITDIKIIGNGARYYLFLDNEKYGIFEAEVLAKHKLKCGESYDDDFFEKLSIENGDYSCFNRSLSVLEKSMKSEKMLRDFLKQKGYPSVSIEKAIEKLKNYGYIDDEAFCENYISSYEDIKSKKKLKYDLIAKGIDKDIIEKKLNDLPEENEFEKCLNFGKKYMKNKDFDIKNKTKLFNHLAGKGFEYSQISLVWDKLEEEND